MADADGQRVRGADQQHHDDLDHQQRRLVTGKGDYASASIFLPAAGYGSGAGLYYSGSDGYYWSSTPSSSHSDYAWYLYFYSGNFRRDYSSRSYGFSVRALRGFAE